MFADASLKDAQRVMEELIPSSPLRFTEDVKK